MTIKIGELIKKMDLIILDIEGSGGSIKNDPYNTGTNTT
jgi:hypothetical protein